MDMVIVFFITLLNFQKPSFLKPPNPLHPSPTSSPPPPCPQYDSSPHADSGTSYRRQREQVRVRDTGWRLGKVDLEKKEYWRMPRGVLASRVCARKNPKSPPLHLQQMLTPQKSPPPQKKIQKFSKFFEGGNFKKKIEN
jgi:hypothetical protein